MQVESLVHLPYQDAAPYHDLVPYHDTLPYHNITVSMMYQDGMHSRSISLTVRSGTIQLYGSSG